MTPVIDTFLFCTAVCQTPAGEGRDEGCDCRTRHNQTGAGTDTDWTHQRAQVQVSLHMCTHTSLFAVSFLSCFLIMTCGFLMDFHHFQYYKRTNLRLKKRAWEIFYHGKVAKCDQIMTEGLQISSTERLVMGSHQLKLCICVKETQEMREVGFDILYVVYVFCCRMHFYWLGLYSSSWKEDISQYVPWSTNISLFLLC